VIALSIGLRNSWDAWTVIPRDRFGARGYSARRWAVEPRRIAATTAFVEHRNPPGRERRGTFSVAGPAGGARRVDDARSSSNVGVAVPRSEYASPSGNYGRRVDPASNDRQGTVAAPGWRERRADDASAAAGGDRRAINRDRGTPGSPGSAQQPAGADHPAYQPQYAPRYQPQYQPQSQTAPQPRSERSYERPQSGYRERQAPDGSPRVTTHEARPRDSGGGESRGSGAAAPSNAPSGGQRDAAPPPAERSSGAPAREPHSRGGGRDGSQGQSGGVAVRRPR
jgi:hypothetical protein